MSIVTIEQIWKRIAEISLGNAKRARMHLDSSVAAFLDIYNERVILLDDFFIKHESPVDICIILYGGLKDSHVLGYHLEGNNLLYYRPKASHKRYVETPFLVGNPDPNHPLLLFDHDLATGNAMREAAKYFRGQGYSEENIFGYADSGYVNEKHGTPELMHIDKLLDFKGGNGR